jgi:tetratricopeptide (TPR) repeat protein
LGTFDKAVAAFLEALPVAERTGDAHYQSVVWSNLALLYEQLGFWNQASKCIVAAVGHANRSTAPLGAFQPYSNAAILAIQLGALQQAEDLLSVAETATKKATSWIWRAELLLDRADLHLAKREEELAWPLIEEVETLARGRDGPRARVSGRERLLRHWTFATRGPAALRDLAESRKGTVDKLGVAERLQVLAFDEWAAQEGERTVGMGVNALVTHGLFGSLAHLIAVNECVLPMEPHEGESSAALVERLFPDPARGGKPPTEIPLR